jgi:hypothetical protein
MVDTGGSSPSRSSRAATAVTDAVAYNWLGAIAHTVRGSAATLDPTGEPRGAHRPGRQPADGAGGDLCERRHPCSRGGQPADSTGVERQPCGHRPAKRTGQGLLIGEVEAVRASAAEPGGQRNAAARR